MKDKNLCFCITLIVFTLMVTQCICYVAKQRFQYYGHFETEILLEDTMEALENRLNDYFVFETAVKKEMATSTKEPESIYDDNARVWKEVKRAFEERIKYDYDKTNAPAE